MGERIELFMNALQKKGHIMQLINKLDICLEVETEDNTCYLYFQKNRIEMTDQQNLSAYYHAKLSGRETLLADLFDGKIKLREAVNDGSLSITCAFRTLLVLESIIFLARPMPAENFV